MRQRVVLDALDAQLAHYERMASRYEVIQQKIKASEDRAVAVGLAGRRRILQRHAPEWREVRHVFGAEVSQQWMCSGCSFRLWEQCPDWLDAAAGLEGTDGGGGGGRDSNP